MAIKIKKNKNILSNVMIVNNYNKKKKRRIKKKDKKIDVPMYKYRITDRDVDALVQLNNIENLIKDRKVIIPAQVMSQVQIEQPIPIKIKKQKPMVLPVDIPTEEEEEYLTTFFETPPRIQKPPFKTGIVRAPLRKVDPMDAIKENYKNNPDFSKSTEKPTGKDKGVKVYNTFSKRDVTEKSEHYKYLLSEGFTQGFGPNGKEIYAPMSYVPKKKEKK